MEDVINIKKYRASKKKSWLLKHYHQLNACLLEYMSLNFGISFVEFAESYQSMQHANYEEAWDYIDLRDLLHSSLEGPFCDELYEQLSKYSWFEKKLFSKEELIEYFIGLYIMGSTGTTEVSL